MISEVAKDRVEGEQGDIISEVPPVVPTIPESAGDLFQSLSPYRLLIGFDFIKP